MCDDFEDDFDDYEGDSFEDGGFDNETDEIEMPLEPSIGPLSWKDWMIIGPMSEEIAREERERRKIEKDISGDKNDDYLDIGP